MENDKVLMTGREVREILALVVPDLPKRPSNWRKTHYLVCAAFCGVPSNTVFGWAKFGVTGALVAAFFGRIRKTCAALVRQLHMHSPDERFEFFIQANRHLCVRPSVVLWRDDCEKLMSHEIACLA